MPTVYCIATGAPWLERLPHFLNGEEFGGLFGGREFLMAEFIRRNLFLVSQATIPQGGTPPLFHLIQFQLF
ncbi:hypothetical protein PAPYR_10755 [Paratrimastix pyriformis]|uniref:Uncharacterized protein n=1 Tax=Paratrimastix pyriformis TaxID=342808 RepID=A0ABQ8U5A7_9EUKA|nr:hypothetical protein PAPYR_10755 [Paratrimastix pyriformis]